MFCQPSWLELRGFEKTAEEAEVKNYLKKIPDNLNLENCKKEIRDAIYYLWSTGRYSSIKAYLIQTNPPKFVLEVTEAPLLKDFEFIGNKKIKDKKLKNLFKPEKTESTGEQGKTEEEEEKFVLEKGDPLNPYNVKRAEKEVKKYYQKKGYARVKVKATATPDGILKFEIKEGPKAFVKAVYFPGAKKIKESKLRGVVKTKAKSLFYGGTLDEEKLQEDVERIKEFYLSKGFFYIKVGKPKVELSKNKKHLYVYFPVKEGPKYYTGDIKIIRSPDDEKIVREKDIKKLITLKSGEAFNKIKLELILFQIGDLYREKGYIRTQVVPDYVIEEESKLIHTKIYITHEPNPAVVEDIRVMGNKTTKEWFIKREILIKPGDIYNVKKVRRSMEKVYNLGFFSDVKFDYRQGSSPDRIILILKVKEKRTGEFTLGGGYSSAEGLLAYTQISKGNILGVGIRVSAKVEAAYKGYLVKDGKFLGDPTAEKKLNFEGSYYNPWVFRSYYSLGIGLKNVTYERVYSKLVDGSTGYASYYDTERGGYLSVGRDIGEDNHLGIKYEYMWEHLALKEKPTSEEGIQAWEELREIVERRPTSVRSSVTLFAYRDTRNNVFFPSKGYYTGINLEHAGGILGGDIRFEKPVVWGSIYKGIIWKISTGFQVKTGAIFFPPDVPEDIKESILISRRDAFFLGGADTVRGYDDYSIKPPLENSVLNDPSHPMGMGGTAKFQINWETFAPIAGGMVKLAVFLDGGRIWEDPAKMGRDLIRWGPKVLKYGIGIGVRLDTPMGPIRLDYGWPFYFDDSWRFHWGREEIPGSEVGKFHFTIGGVFY